ncbi:MAG: glycosyltransferase family 92 protein [Puniceicoccales bacterium]|nr:glycosyltransferase family 92 protein [Puniceicoccales bacterium]
MSIKKAKRNNNTPQRHIRVLVGICTARPYLNRRQAIRETWLSKEVENVHAVFFHGKTEIPTENPADTVELNVPDTYDLLPTKVLAFFRYALEHYDFEWIFKCDDDTYLAMERVVSMLDDNYGLIGDRMLESRGAPSGGAGYFLSRRSIEQLLEQQEDIAQSGPEDLIIGRFASDRLKIPFLASKRLCSSYSQIPRKDNDFVSAHWCSPQKLRTIHAVFSCTPIAICEGIHTHWSDRVLFFSNGLYCRFSTGCTGRWSFNAQGALSLRWDEWRTEILATDGENYVCSGFTLRLVQGELPVRIEENTFTSSDSSLTYGKRVLLFRCHTHWEKCRETLKILKHFNPTLPIYILYGGPRQGESSARKLAAEFAEGFWSYQADEISAHWKWQHGDEMIRAWYEHYGYSVDFSHIYSYEWDILPVAPLEEIYPKFEADAVYMSPLRPFTPSYEKQWAWTANGKWRDSSFMKYMKTHYGVSRPKYCTLGPAVVFSRKFLELSRHLPNLSGVHEEIAIPALAEAFGLPLYDTGIYTHPRNKNQHFWNTTDSIKRTRLQNEVSSVTGMQIFHPVKYIVTLEEVLAWKRIASAQKTNEDVALASTEGGAVAAFRALNTQLYSQFDPTWNFRHNLLRREMRKLNALGRPVHILEWGSGTSTAILCDGLKEGSHVLSIEHDVVYRLGIPEKWRTRLTQKILATQRPYGNSENYVTYPLLKHLQDGIKYDLILIDGRNRADCLAVAALLLADDGVVFLNDAERNIYQCNFPFFQEVNEEKAPESHPSIAVLRKPLCIFDKKEISTFPALLSPSENNAQTSWGICTVTLPRESQPWLRDWIEHHVKAGASKVVVYDNTGSTGSLRPGTVFAGGRLQKTQVSKRGEEYGRLTRHLSDEEISQELRDIAATFPNDRVEIIRWRPRNPRNKQIIHGQVEAYCDFIRRFRDLLTWGTFLDMDEYLYCAPGLTVQNMLAQLAKENPTVGALQLQSWGFECRWGTDGPKNIRDLATCIPAASQFSDKSFVRMSDVTHANIHMNWRFRNDVEKLRANPQDFAFCHYNLSPGELHKAKEYILPRAFLEAPPEPIMRLRTSPPTSIVGEGPLEPMQVDTAKVLQID